LQRRLAEPRDTRLFDAPAKLVGRQTGDRIVACLDEERRVARDSTWLVVPREGGSPDELLWLLAVLNDPIATELFRLGDPDEVGKVFAQVRIGSVRRLPCPPLERLPAASKERVLKAVRERLDASQADRRDDLDTELHAGVRRAFGLSEKEAALLGSP